MDYKKLPDEMKQRLKEVERLLRRDLPTLIGHEAAEHFADNFRRGGFVDNGLKKWADVKRRDESSSWYGFEYRGEKRTHYAFIRDKNRGKTSKAKQQKRLNYSESATRRAVLTSKRNVLINSIEFRQRPGRVTVFSAAPHAQIHNEGGTFKVFGRATATMPARKFIGHSAELDKKVEQEIIRQIDKIFKQ